jgi:CRP/FNR family transcriptional regulator, cyclic AMP receptor protein
MWQELLGGTTRQVHVSAGELIFGTGREPSIALILAGVVRVFIATQPGRQLTIRYSRAGDLIGLGAVLAASDAWNAEAIADTTLTMLTIDDFRAAAERNPQLPWDIAEGVAAWATEAVVMMADSSQKPMSARVAFHLREIAQRAPDGRAVAHISQQRLADAVGTVREVISRELRTLRAQGVIDTGPEVVIVMDEPRLERIAATTLLGR